MKYTFKSWAINTQSPEGHGFLGKGWWFFGKPTVIPGNLLGCKISLFDTRKDARDALQDLRGKSYNPFPKAKLSRVEITIKEI